MTDPAGEYLKYAREVLGLREFIQPKSSDSELAEVASWAKTRTGHWPAPAEFDLLILHQGAGLFHGEIAELWDKMKTAMNLGSAKILEIELHKADIEGALLELLALYPAAAALLLLEQPARMDG